MALIPDAGSIQIGQNVEVQTTRDQPSRTWQIDFEKKRIVGWIDEKEAMVQAIQMIIMTERFKYLILSWNYGIELDTVHGKSFPVVSSEIKRTLREALLADARIEDVQDITVSQVDKRTVLVNFTASTVFGNIPVSAEVNTNV